MFIDVFQVMRKYPLAGLSMDQLQACYVQHYSEQFPLAQYMSLYDTWEASNPPSKPTADPVTILQLETTAGSQI